jgi:3-methyl-2-oxobutanoate hydroxymethyltransferase
MLHHVKAVGRGAKRSFVICDMPFGSFKTCEEALKNARLFIEAGADGIKMEGEQESIAQLACVASAGIPVCGHIGYTPQTDGAKAAVQGKDLQRAQELLSIAKEIEKAGAFMLVLELIPEQLAKKITRHVKIPTIGIGAGRFCDGQVQVVYDIAGMSERLFRHSKVFGDMASEFRKVLNSYTEEVRRGTFPAEKNSSKLPENIQDELEDWLKSLQKT